MPVRYAVTSGSWSTGSIWDNGAVPLDGDDVYANGFNITIDQNINVLKFSNRLSPARVPALATPSMTSNTAPSGVAFASSAGVNSPAWQAFDQLTSTFWQSLTLNTGIIGYQFPTGKIIKQYAFLSWTSNVFNPTAWTFQGSNDGISYTTIETVTGFTPTISTWYIRNVSSNTTSYTYYRMNITVTGGSSPVIAELQMTESTGSVYGTIASGSFISTNNIQITASTPISTAFPGKSGIVSATTGPAFIITGSHTVYMSGSIQGGDASSGNGVRITNGGTLYVTGSISSGNAGGGSTDNYGLLIVTGSAFIRGNLRTNGDAGNTAGACVFINNGTASIVGDLYSATNHAPLAIGAGSAQVNFSGSAFILGTSTGNMQVQLRAANSGVLNYTGPVIGNNSSGIGLGVGTMTVNITGSVSTRGAASGLISTVASTINVNGSITSGPAVPGLQSTSTSGLVRVTGPLLSINNYPAVYSPRIQLISTSTPTYEFQTDTFPRDVIFYDAAYTSSLPAQTDVRSASLYGGSNEFSGSMIIPSSSDVRYGVPVDTITGSAANITPQDIFDYAVSSLTGSNTIGERLQNISTTQTTAATIAAFKGK